MLHGRLALDLDGMVTALRSFRSPADRALIYVASHDLEIGGVTYVIQ